MQGDAAFKHKCAEVKTRLTNGPVLTALAVLALYKSG
jgi:hypothetical protein